jgi:hypothetical protein
MFGAIQRRGKLAIKELFNFRMLYYFRFSTFDFNHLLLATSFAHGYACSAQFSAVANSL